MRGDCDKTLLLEIIQGHAHNRFLKLLRLKITLVEVQASVLAEQRLQAAFRAFFLPPSSTLPFLFCRRQA